MTAPTMSAPWRMPMPLSGSSRRAASSAVTMPSGRLTKKIQCQLTDWVMRPPAIRPTTAPEEATKLKMPKAFALLHRLGEKGDDHGEDHRRAHRAADALDEAGGDQHRLAEREAAEKRRGGEQRETREEDPLATDEVADAAGEQEQAAERNQVRVDHPGEAGLGETEVTLDGRKRDVDDGHVDHDQQKACAKHQQRKPA